jgi:DNA-directed RNA polymerase subunit alpha
VIHSLTKVLDITDDMIEKGKGEYRVTLRDIMGPSDFEIVNPDHHIFSVTRPMTRRIDIKVGMGRGYVPSERHVFERGVDEIVIDSSFSPVRLVNYYVENTRVGQDTDFDRLIFEVTTDARVSPAEALSFAAQIGVHHLQVFEKVQAHTILFDRGEINVNQDRDEVLQKLALRINEIELSVRSTNCLENAKIEFIGELVLMKEDEMLRFRNFGKKSLTEIRQKLEELELSLGMDLSRYGITRDNVRSIILQYLQDKAGSLEATTPGNVEL